MAKQLRVEIVTHHGITFTGEADSLVAPGVQGYFGLLPNHAPMIAELGIGDVRVRQGETWRHFAVTGGILHVRGGEVLIMADAAEPATEIDVKRAREAADRARARLASHRAPEVDQSRAEVALQRALNRLRVADRASD